MLFDHRFHAGIRDGSVQVTFRAWKTARVIPGRRYLVTPIGAVEVDSVTPTTPRALRDADARRAGFADRAELIACLGAAVEDPARTLFRVAFHFVGADPREALRDDASAAAVIAVDAQLTAIDRRSRRGPWTERVLRLIASHPRVLAATLAATLGEQTRDFKVSVRKLKGIGLTVSCEVGYELSARGEAVLRLRDQRGRS